METTRVFSELLKGYTEGYRILNSCGGTRSTKTYSAIQLLVILAAYDRKATITSVVSETLPHLKKGAIRDFETIMRDEGLWDDDSWNATDKIYTFRTGSIIEFFSADSPGKVHGPSRDRLFMNEAQNLPWEVANQLMIRTRGLVIIDYNPTHEFWVHTEIERENWTYTVRSTYRDNPYLTEWQIMNIEKGKKNANWWRVYGEGLTGELRGLIYRFEQIERMPDPTGLIHLGGLDYGFTNDPTVFVDILADSRKKKLYIDERIYRTHMYNSDIIKEFKKQDVSYSFPIYADCSEPKANSEIGAAGYNIKGCYKGKDLEFQINFMQDWEWYITQRSVNLIREGRGYTWAEDKDGKLLNEPIDENNHGMDAIRYAIFTKFGDFKKPTSGGKPRRQQAWG